MVSSSEEATAGGGALFARRNAILAGVGAFVLLGLAGTGWILIGGGLRASAPADAPEKSIAVLPFEDLSPFRDQQYFVDGLSEEIINALTRLSDLKVTARPSTFQLAEQGADIAAIANTLGVANVLEGSVRKEGGQIRVSVTLIGAASGSRLWSDAYDGDLTSVFAIQDAIAREVMDRLRVGSSGGEEASLVAQATEITEAYEAYLTGRFFFNQRTPESLRQGIGQFQRAIRLDPEYAEAYAGLADSYNMLRVYFAQDGFFDRERQAAQTAVDLAPDLATAHRSLAEVLTSQGQWEGAQREYELAISLSPGYARAHAWLGTLMSLTGRPEEGLPHAQKGAELDPVSFGAGLAEVFERLRRYREAAAEYRRASALNPALASNFAGLARVLVAMGDYDGAEEAYDEYSRLIDASLDPQELGERVGAYARFAQRGYPQLIDPEPGISAASQAWHFVRTGQPDRAIEALERTIVGDNGYWQIAEFDSREVGESLRNDRRYRALLEEAGITW